MSDHRHDPQAVRLSDGEVTCTLMPELGGALLSLEIGNMHILRPSAVRPADILHTASFPLLPFANRIDNGHFRFGDRLISLPADSEAQPHALHGHGWKRPWQLIASDHTRATMEFVHAAGAWPWQYRATQRMQLLADGLAISLAVANQSDQPMPCGFGIHPYFDLRPDSYLLANAPERLCPDERGIPGILRAGLVGRHLISALPPSDDLLLDDTGQLRVGTSTWEARLTASETAGWQFYIPPDRDYFCLEPVSHRPDSFSLAGPVDVIEPGDSREWQCAIRRTR